MQAPDPEFPPLLSGHDVKGGVDPFEKACAEATAGRIGAGDLVWSRNESRVAMALVLEPEVPLQRSVEMMPLAQVAAGDCLGVLTPPQVAVMFRWPNVILINGGVVGAVQGAYGGAADRDEVPDWLAIGIWIQHRRERQDGEPGETPDVTWLSEEGCGDLNRTELLESYSRHLLTWINSWQDEGFRSIHEAWLYRAEGHGERARIGLEGAEREDTLTGLDENGNLLLKSPGGAAHVLDLLDHFEAHPGRLAAP